MERVKVEKTEPKTEPKIEPKTEPKIEPPWAVTVKRESNVVVSVHPKVSHSGPPWQGPPRVADVPRRPKPVPKQKNPPISTESVRRARKKPALGDDTGSPAQPGWERAPGDIPSQDGRLVSLRNYAAVDTENGRYGLIDRGVQETGIQTLVMHAPKRSDESREDALDCVRPGTVLRVSSTEKAGGRGALRVRFTTPAKYYSPGARVTTLCIGVDASDWQDLMQ